MIHCAGKRRHICSYSGSFRVFIEVRDFEEEKSLVWCAAAALVVAAALAGCGGTTYFAGRNLPPSGLTNRVLIAVQNPSAFAKGALHLWMPTTTSAAATTASPRLFASQATPAHCRSPSRTCRKSRSATSTARETEASRPSAMRRRAPTGAHQRTERHVFQHLCHPQPELRLRGEPELACATVVDRTSEHQLCPQPAGCLPRECESRRIDGPGLRENSNYVYYPIKLTAAQTTNFSGGPATWPRAAVDCEPQNAPGWCLLPAQSPDNKTRPATTTARRSHLTGRSRRFSQRMAERPTC